MVRKHILISLVLSLCLAPASFARIRCAAWYLCGYSQDGDDARTRQLDVFFSIPSSDFSMEWSAIEVEGNQALVCSTKVLARPGTCSLVTERQLSTYIKPPHVAFFDDATQTIKFYDGLEGRREQKRVINPRTVIQKISSPAITDSTVRGLPPKRDILR